MAPKIRLQEILTSYQPLHMDRVEEIQFQALRQRKGSQSKRETYSRH